MARKTLIQFRRDTAANWTSVNPTLAAGEYGFETDTGKTKLGNGSTAWQTLEYYNYIASQKDVTLSSIQTNDYLKWNGTAWVNSALPAGVSASTIVPSMDAGVGATGDGTTFARDNHVHPIDTSRAPVADPTFTGVPAAPTAAAGTSTTQIATTAFVQAAFGQVDAMLYKGVIDCSSTPNYPAGVAGDVYKVSVAGKIGGASGIVVEVGDMVICAEDASAGTQAAVGSKWNIVQTNIDGAVTGPASSIDTQIALLDGVSGKVLKASLATIDATGTINIPSGQAYKINGTAIAASDVGAIPTIAGVEKGDVMIYNGSAWTYLHHGTQYQVLSTGGDGADPSWADLDGGSA